MSQDASLQRLLEMVERGAFTPSSPGELQDAWHAALRKEFVAQSDGDDCALTDVGRAYLTRLREGPDYWAWPFYPLNDRMAMNCKNAKSKRQLTPRWNLEKYCLALNWLTALPNPGEDFGVIIHDANPNQIRTGVGRRYYVPTLDDLSIVQELFPSANPGNPPWNQIETELVLAAKDKKELRHQNAAILIRLLQKARLPAPATASTELDGGDALNKLRTNLAAAQAGLGKSRYPAPDWSGILTPADTTIGEVAGISAIGIQAREERQKMRELVAQLRGTDPGGDVDAAVLDIFAHEYGWTTKEYASLTGYQTLMYLRNIVDRHKKTEPVSQNSEKSATIQGVKPDAALAEQTDPVTRAIALMLAADKEGMPIKITDLPDIVGCSRSKLYRDAHFKATVKALKAKKRANIPKGSKTKDGNVEAEYDPNEE